METTSTPKPKAFRLQCKCFYGTWPQCTMDKADLLANAIRLLPPISWAVVASEMHKDGTPHLHGIFYFEEKIDLKDANPTLDLIAMKHGNYQGAKSPTKVLRYVVKDDNYITHGDVPDWKEKPKIMTKMATAIMAGASFNDCMQMDAGVSMLHKRKIEEFEAYCKRQRADSDKLVWQPLSMPEDPNLCLLVDWLNSNMMVKSRKFRAPQLYVCGAPGLGKTRLVNQLRRFARVYMIPTCEDFYDDWFNDQYDLAILDEFKGNKSVQWLNGWLDGQVLPLRKKGSQYLKAVNVATIILSNYTLEECYKAAIEKDARFAVSLEALHSRLTSILVWESFNLFPNMTDY